MKRREQVNVACDENDRQKLLCPQRDACTAYSSSAATPLRPCSQASDSQSRWWQSYLSQSWSDAASAAGAQSSASGTYRHKSGRYSWLRAGEPTSLVAVSKSCPTRSHNSTAQHSTVACVFRGVEAHIARNCDDQMNFRAHITKPGRQDELRLPHLSKAHAELTRGAGRCLKLLFHLCLRPTRLDCTSSAGTHTVELSLQLSKQHTRLGVRRQQQADGKSNQRTRSRSMFACISRRSRSANTSLSCAALAAVANGAAAARARASLRDGERPASWPCCRCGVLGAIGARAESPRRHAYTRAPAHIRESAKHAGTTRPSHQSRG